MSEAIPPGGDVPPPPPGPSGPGFWQQPQSPADPTGAFAPPASTPGGDIPPPPPPGGGLPAPPAAPVPPPVVPPAYVEPQVLEPHPMHQAPSTAMAGEYDTTFGEASTRGGPQYAGFWRRFWARFITGVMASVILSLGYSVLLGATLWVYANVGTCTANSSGRQFCQREPVILLVGLVATWAFGLVASYYIWSRRLATNGGTVGMHQMGLRIRGAGEIEQIGKPQAFRRSLISLLPFVFSSGAGWIILYEPSTSLLTLVGIINAGLVAIIVLGGLWMLFSERRQTAWDLVGDTVVVVDREPSWVSLAAFLVGVLVPYGIALTLSLTGVSALRADYDDIAEGAWSVSRILAVALPVGAVALGAIILGHLGVRSTTWEARRLAGRGLARTGMLLGYSVPALVVGAIAFNVVYDRIESRKDRTCTEVRKELVLALESYKTLNGTYPTGLNEVLSPVYSNEPDASTTWEIELTTPDGLAYELTGKGACEKA